MLDVGAIVRQVQAAFRLFGVPGAQGRNLATPRNLLVLIEQLRALTDELIEQRIGLGVALPSPAMAQWDTDYSAWRDRLGEYFEAASSAAPDDRRAVLWSVTAPLLLGHYPTGGPQRVADVATPFSLANQLDVDDDWADERLGLLFSDIVDEARRVVADPLKQWALPVAAALALLWWVRR